MERQRLDVLLSSGIHWLFLGLFFFLPLLFFRQASEVFEFPKMLFVYAATVIICALWLGRMIVQKRLLIHKTPLDIPILLFLLSQVVSTIYSIDPRTSWFGYYGRFHGGLLSTISYTLLYYAFVNSTQKTMSRERGVARMGTPPSPRNESSSEEVGRGAMKRQDPEIVAILASAFLVSLYAILQHFGIDKNFWIQDVVNRVFSTQGQPNWLAGYIVMVLPLLLAKAITREKAFGSEAQVFDSEVAQTRGARRGQGIKEEQNGWGGEAGIVKRHASSVSDEHRNPHHDTSFANATASPTPRSSWPLALSSLLFLVILFTKSRSGLIGFAIMDGIFWSLILCNYLLHGRSSKQQPTSSGTKKQYRLKTIVFNLNSLTKHFVLIHVLMAGLILATNNPAREWLLNNEIATSPSTNAQAFGSEAQDIRLRETQSRRARRGLRNDVVKAPALEDSIVLRKSAQGGTESGDIRRLVWSGAIELVKQRPLFGTGPETFAYTYWWVRPATHNLTSEWNFLYNKAHNEWLNLAANTGIFGLGAHLMLILWFSVWSIKRTLLAVPASPVGGRQGESLINTAFLAALLGVEAVNFFGFSTVTVGAYTSVYMAMAVATVQKLDRATSSKLNMSSYFLLMSVVLAALYLLSQISISFLADLSYARGRAYLENRYAFQALRPLEIAAELVSDEPIFRSSLAEDEGLLAISLDATGEQPDLAEKLKNESLSNFDVVEKENPYSLSFLKTASRIVYSLGVFDPTLYDRGIALSEKAAKLAPTNPSIPYTLGVMSEAMGKNGDAKEFYQQALELKPDYMEAQEKLKTIPPGFHLQESP